jgi:hypothetical protein
VLAISAAVAVAQFSAAANATPGVTTLALGNPGTASAATTDGCTTVTIDWTSATSADSYRVQVKKGVGAWNDLYLETANVTQATDATGHTATDVSYRIFSRDANSDWEGPAPAVTNTLAC